MDFAEMQTATGHEHLPERIYKFTERRFAEEMLQGRSIRIGTIREFRDQEKHQLQKGDPREGKIFIGYGPFTIGSNTTPGLHRFLKQKGFNVENSTIGPTFGQPAIEVDGPDGNILCLSLAIDEKTRQSLDTRYDACVEIGNPANFINNLGAAVYKYLGRFGSMQCGARSVEYRSKFFSHLDTDFSDDWWIKDLNFAFQREFRILFDHQGPIEPFIIGFNASGCEMRIL